MATGRLETWESKGSLDMEQMMIHRQQKFPCYNQGSGQQILDLQLPALIDSAGQNSKLLTAERSVNRTATKTKETNNL